MAFPLNRRQLLPPPPPPPPPQGCHKMALPGGNSILAAGGFAAPGNDMQKKAGIKDSPELLLADMLRAGGHLNHVECAKVVAYGAYDTYRWATDYLGVKWDRLSFHGGPSGGSILRQLYERHRSRHHRPNAHEALHTEGSCASAHEAPQLCYR